MRGSKYTRAVLLPLVQTSRSLKEVSAKLGLRPVAGNDRNLRSRIRIAELDTSHFVHGSLTRRIRELTIQRHLHLRLLCPNETYGNRTRAGEGALWYA